MISRLVAERAAEIDPTTRSAGETAEAYTTASASSRRRRGEGRGRLRGLRHAGDALSPWARPRADRGAAEAGRADVQQRRRLRLLLLRPLPHAGLVLRTSPRCTGDRRASARRLVGVAQQVRSDADQFAASSSPRAARSAQVYGVVAPNGAQASARAARCRPSADAQRRADRRRWSAYVTSLDGTQQWDQTPGTRTSGVIAGLFPLHRRSPASPSTRSSVAGWSSSVGVLVLMGSVYLLLATNTGARPGLLIAFTGLFGWMTIMGAHLVDLRHRPRGPAPAWDGAEVNRGDLTPPSSTRPRAGRQPRRETGDDLPARRSSRRPSSRSASRAPPSPRSAAGTPCC